MLIKAKIGKNGLIQDFMEGVVNKYLNDTLDPGLITAYEAMKKEKEGDIDG